MTIHYTIHTAPILSKTAITHHGKRLPYEHKYHTNNPDLDTHCAASRTLDHCLFVVVIAPDSYCVCGLVLSYKFLSYMLDAVLQSVCDYRFAGLGSARFSFARLERGFERLRAALCHASGRRRRRFSVSTRALFRWSLRCGVSLALPRYTALQPIYGSSSLSGLCTLPFPSFPFPIPFPSLLCTPFSFFGLTKFTSLPFPTTTTFQPCGSAAHDSLLSSL